MIDFLKANCKEFICIFSECEVNITHIKFINVFNNIKSILLCE